MKTPPNKTREREERGDSQGEGGCGCFESLTTESKLISSAQFTLDMRLLSI